MAKNKIVSFISALVISAIISGFVYILLFIQTFDLFGVDEIRDPESRDAKLFYTGLVMTILTILIVTDFFRNNRKYAAAGIALPNLIGLFLVLRVGVIYFNKFNYYEKFDRQTWLNSGEKPLKMARCLVKDNVLIGLTKEKVIEALGKGKVNNCCGTENFRYYLSEHYATLELTFEKGKVKTTHLLADD